VTPKHYDEWECSSLSRILQEQGQDALDLTIMKEYESGMFQRGSNKYVRALEVLRRMPEYVKFNWRTISYDDEYHKIRSSEEFHNVLLLALKTPPPRARFVIVMDNMLGPNYLMQRKRCVVWTHNMKRAVVFRYRQDAEDYMTLFSNAVTKGWYIEQIKGEEVPA
jgi:hypothetical protein